MLTCIAHVISGDLCHSGDPRHSVVTHVALCWSMLTRVAPRDQWSPASLLVTCVTPVTHVTLW